MNKKLIALAVAGAATLPIAAQAHVTIYGKIHVSVEHIDNDVAGVDDSTSVSSNSSRIGFKGAEDLGNGMRAIWQIEQEVGLTDTITKTWASRNSFVGLAGNFGTVIAGRHDTPFKSVGRKGDFFGDQIGDSRNVISAVQSHDVRPDNVIAYVSPELNGLQAALAYSTDASGDGKDDNDTDAVSLSLTYGNGPLWLGFAHQKINTSATLDTDSNWMVGSYRFGDFKVAALWQSTELAAGMDVDAWGLGGSYTMGNNTIKAQYYTLDDTEGTSDSGADLWAIGFDHQLSRRTSLYAAYAAADNDTNQTIKVTGGGHGDDGLGTLAGGEDPSAFAVGLIHKF